MTVDSTTTPSLYNNRAELRIFVPRANNVVHIRKQQQQQQQQKGILQKGALVYVVASLVVRGVKVLKMHIKLHAYIYLRNEKTMNQAITCVHDVAKLMQHAQPLSKWTTK
jgi:hypothetical protein